MSFEAENRALESGLLPKICIIIMSTQAINEFHLTGDNIKPGILNVYQEMMWNTGTPSVLYYKTTHVVYSMCEAEECKKVQL